jgi:hypothetical protein
MALRGDSHGRFGTGPRRPPADGHEASERTTTGSIYYFRAVLSVLNREGPASISALAHALVDRDFEDSGVAPRAADYARTRRELRTVYLPHLAAADLITDPETCGPIAIDRTTTIDPAPLSLSGQR